MAMTGRSDTLPGHSARDCPHKEGADQVLSLCVTGVLARRIDDAQQVVCHGGDLGGLFHIVEGTLR
jgi:hypothetical protein